MDNVDKIIKQKDFMRNEQEEIIKEEISIDDSFNEETE